MKIPPVYNNTILHFLSADEQKVLEKCLKKIEMPLGEVLYRSSEKIEYIYFPETCVISIVNMLEDGSTIESGIIGKDGFSGAAVDLSEDVSPLEATIQLAGEVFRLPIAEFKVLFEQNKSFRDASLRYIYAFIAQLAQNAACLSYHKIEQRLARWLLMFDDRSEREKLNLTQEYIAQMLGVHRPTVSKNANELQKMGFISYNRGAIKITDRAGLENFTCECYAAISQAVNRVARRAK